MAFTRVLRANGTLGRLTVCALLASACISLVSCDQTEKTRKMMDQRAGEAQQMSDASHKTSNPVGYDPLTVTSKVWSGSTALRMQHGLPLPPRYETVHGVTLVSADQMTLTEIANAISAQTGVPIRLSAMAVPGKSSVAATPAPTPAASSPFGASSMNSTSSTPSMAAVSNSSNEPMMPVSYEGPLSGLLERVSANFGVNWRYDGSAISISKFETRIFTVEALPGTQEVNEGMQDDTSSSSSSGGSGGGSSGGGSSGGSSGSSGSSGGSSGSNTLTQNSKFKIELKYWEELNLVLGQIVNGNGTVITSPSMGTVTVTTTPDLMVIVNDYLSKENKRLSRQIAINVQIYVVNLGQSEDFSVAFTGFLKNLTKFSGLNYTSAAAPGILNTNLTSGSLGALSVAILNGPADPTAHAGDIFNALSTIGDTTSVAQFPMTTLNNRPVSRRVGVDQSYISTVNTNTTSTAATPTTTYTPVVSTIHEGFSLQLTPRLLDDGRILLQYSLSLIGLDSIGNTSFDTGSGTIPLSLPVTDNRIFVQQSMLRSGSTLMIGGVDQEQMQQQRQGVGSPDNFLLGGGTSTNNTHLMMFMAITPQVMDVSEPEHN